MLSVPSNWSDLYFDIFALLCALGELFVICYVIISPPQGAGALDIAADILFRLAAVPIAAGLQAFLIMKARDMVMRTWERYKQERIEQGVEIGVGIGRVEGREDLAREVMEIMDKQPPDKVVKALHDFLSEVRKNGSENGNGKRE